MTNTNETQNSDAELRARYLTDLDLALTELPHGMATELRSGVVEELAELDGDELQRRIAELGPPEDVARAARVEGLGEAPLDAFGAQAAPANHRTVTPLSESRGYAIAAAIVFGIGGLALPIIGWVIGCGLVATSKFWRVREKAWAIATPLLVLAVSFLAIWVAAWAGGSGELNGGDGSQGADLASNPLMPAGYDLLFSAVLLVWVVAVPLVGLWLILRLRGRHSPQVRS